ncbi:MAG TPA: hemerythrin domain-containing protein [Burkholderiaceae bacterium]|nr:hemerythrin domain-containing protein [Burkholderiaceae bacterium]
MNFVIPATLQQEHEALHEELRRATQAGAEVGEAARDLARLMHPHFVKEDEIALPPLGLLPALARAGASPGMAEVLALTDRLEAELPEMLREHEAIVGALQRLQQAAQRADRPDIVAFARRLVQHARTEEEVMYPAAVLVGRYIRLQLDIEKQG